MRISEPIGVIDSGVGGLSVLRCLRRLMPHERFIYLGDTARTPYGVRPEAEIRGFVNEMLDYLEAQGVKLLVIACNTLTMLGTESLERGRSFKIIGMSKGTRQLLAASASKRVAVWATPFTISTGTHKRLLLEAEPRAEVVTTGCAKFVTLVEREQFDSEELRDAIREYACELRAAGADALILSCTHFPFLREQIAAELGAGVRIVDPAEETSQTALEALRSADLLRSEGEGATRVCATADIERVKRLTARMLPLEGCSFEKIVLNEN